MVQLKIKMATYSPPTTPQIDPDIREDLLRCLDQEIQATQVRHDEAQRRLRCERRHATTHDPFWWNNLKMQKKWVIKKLTSISNMTIPLIWLVLCHPNHQSGNKLIICMRILKSSGDLVPVFLKDQWPMYQTKLRWTCFLLWCGPDGEDIYEGFNLSIHQWYDLELIWSLFDKHCEPICNFCAARWKFRTVTQAPSETLDTFYNRILKLAKQCQFEPAEEKSRLIDAIIYGTSITKTQEKLLQTPIMLTLDQCLGICRHYESLKISLGDHQT